MKNNIEFTYSTLVDNSSKCDRILHIVWCILNYRWGIYNVDK